LGQGSRRPRPQRAGGSTGARRPRGGARERRHEATGGLRGRLVSRFRSSHHCAAHSFANFGIKGTLAIYDSSAVFGFEVPTRTRGYNDRNFKSTALVWRFRSPHHSPGESEMRTFGSVTFCLTISTGPVLRFPAFYNSALPGVAGSFAVPTLRAASNANTDLPVTRLSSNRV
jgi:hypothetical protein